MLIYFHFHNDLQFFSHWLPFGFMCKRVKISIKASQTIPLYPLLTLHRASSPSVSLKQLFNRRYVSPVCWINQVHFLLLVFSLRISCLAKRHLMNSNPIERLSFSCCCFLSWNLPHICSEETVTLQEYNFFEMNSRNKCCELKTKEFCGNYRLMCQSVSIPVS